MDIDFAAAEEAIKPLAILYMQVEHVQDGMVIPVTDEGQELVRRSQTTLANMGVPSPIAMQIFNDAVWELHGKQQGGIPR